MEGWDGDADHWYWAGLTLEARLTRAVGEPRQTPWLMELLVTAGFGLTVTVCVAVVPTQLSMFAVIVYITDCAVFDELAKVLELTGEPEPDPGQGVMNPVPQG